MFLGGKELGSLLATPELGERVRNGAGFFRSSSWLGDVLDEFSRTVLVLA